MEHHWIEVIPPRVYGGDTEEKMALQCDQCGKRIIVSEREVKYVHNYPCPGSNVPDIDKLLEGLEWQLTDPEMDSWEFGRKVRGIVRKPLGEIYFNPYKGGAGGGWIWLLNIEHTDPLFGKRGQTPYRWDAVNQVETHVAEYLSRSS
jgi:DNA-directed RNA polymerase subunit RPC12/RpoP